MTPGPQIIGYIRVSGLSQVHEGDGLGLQREKIERWCQFQGVGPARIEEDAGLSGASTDNRPGLRRALRAALQGGAGTVLIVYKLDRLGRNAIDVQEVLAVLLDAGVRVVSLADGIDSSSGMGAALLKLLTGILATFAELERETIRQRLQDGRRRAKAQGRIYSCAPPYGQKRAAPGERELEAEPDEKAAIERIKQLRGEGLSYRKIAQALQEEGFRPRHAETWAAIVVQRLATGRRPPPPAKKNSRLARVRAAWLEPEHPGDIASPAEHAGKGG